MFTRVPVCVGVGCRFPDPSYAGSVGFRFKATFPEGPRYLQLCAISLSTVAYASPWTTTLTRMRMCGVAVVVVGVDDVVYDVVVV